MRKHEYTTEVVEKATLLGQCQFTLEESALILGVQESEMHEEQLLSAYRKGRLDATVAVRKAVVERARDGDLKSIQAFMKWAEESDLEG